MEEVGEKKAKVTKELRENGLANSTETEWIDRHMTDFSIVHVGKRESSLRLQLY